MKILYIFFLIELSNIFFKKKELSKFLKKLFFFSPILTNNNLSLKIYCENIVIVFLNFNFSFFILFFPYFFTFFSSIFPFLFFFSFFSPPHTYPSNYFFSFFFPFLSPFSLPEHSRTFHFCFFFPSFPFSLTTSSRMFHIFFSYHFLQNVPLFFFFFLISPFSLPLPPKNSVCRKARVFGLVE